MSLSFALAILWFLAHGYLSKRVLRYRLAVVPGGATANLLSIDLAEWIELDRPIPVNRKWTGVVVDLNADLPDEWERFIAASALAGIPVYHVKQIYELLTGRVDIGHLSENTLGSLNPNEAYFEVKQTADWISALVFLLMLSPLFLFVAIADKARFARPRAFPAGPPRLQGGRIHRL